MEHEDGKKVALLPRIQGKVAPSTSTITNLPEFCPLGQATASVAFPTLQYCGRSCALGESHAYEGQVDWGVGLGPGSGDGCSGADLAASRPSRRNRDFP